MKLQVKVKGNHGRISLISKGLEAGYLTFDIEDQRKLIAHHTVVHEDYRGQGWAKQLAEALAAYSVKHKYLVEPVCAYIRSLSERGGLLTTRLEYYSAADEILQRLEQGGDEQQAKALARFLQASPGGYGEGDLFYGWYVPDLRALLKEYKNLSRATLHDLWLSPYHEARQIACFAIADWAERASSDESRAAVYDFYMAHAERCNNWDLVDSSVRSVFACYWLTKDPSTRRQALLKLADNPNLWVQRIAVVGTYGFICSGLYDDTFALVLHLKTHRHDLIQKAMGWMLREICKRIGADVLRGFLYEHADELPRTTLRAAIELFDKAERQVYLARDSKPKVLL